MIKLVSHCHSYHSFDSSMVIDDIVCSAKSAGINAIILNDHDVYSLSDDERKIFFDSGIKLLNAIEFTTKEGVHVIGIHSNIKKLMNKPFYYEIKSLLVLLKNLGSKIIFPHPYHATGIFGNKNINKDLFEMALKYCDGFEVDNYRYGPTPSWLIQDIKKITPRAVEFIASDAHRSAEVSAFINVYDMSDNLDEKDLIEFIFSLHPRHLRLKKRSWIYFSFKRFQKTFFYQMAISIFSPKIRKKIKNKLGMDK